MARQRIYNATVAFAAELGEVLVPAPCSTMVVVKSKRSGLEEEG